MATLAGLPGLIGSAALCGGAGPAAAQPLSERIASYRIEVRLDHPARTLAGRQVLTWRNAGETAAAELRFHLYWNAWRNDRSTWMLEDRIRGRSDRGEEIAAGDWSWIEVDEARLLPSETGSGGAAGADRPGADLAPGMRFDAPDDDNPEDRTVLVVPLPRPIEPGETARVEMAWRAKVPRTFARTGFRGDFYFLAHWFPKLGVWEDGAWNCHQYHSATEYYSDYGVYDVSMTVPEGWVVGATGREVERREAAPGETLHRYVQEDVHAFTWTTSPDYLDLRDRFDAEGLPPVDLRLLLQPEHLDQADRHFHATKAALAHYGRWFGPYPYGHLTIVDPAYGAGAGGMEYPTLFTSGTRISNPFGAGSPESVTIHEAGHQFWYGIVGNNEFEHAWIDEGLNTYSTGRVFDLVYGDRIFSKRYFAPPGIDADDGFYRHLFRDVRESWSVPAERLNRYRRSATADVEATPTWRYFPASASDITYSKTALWLMTLERWLGWDALQRILSIFFERWRFKHPGPEDFLAVAREVGGPEVDPFFDQVFFADATFDYAIESVASFPAAGEGWFGDGAERAYRPLAGEAGDTVYRTEVVVRREGEGVFPVEVLLVFEDGETVRRAWEGRERWTLLVEERPAKLEYAVVDPERVLILDLDYTNNSRRLDSRATFPAVKWAARWLVWLQDLLLAFGTFA